jgi:hypothetical protein
LVKDWFDKALVGYGIVFAKALQHWVAKAYLGTNQTSKSFSFSIYE